MVYEPREDSQLLASAVQEHTSGRTIDVGTGSGILARTARDGGADTVIAVDIDPEAVEAARAQGLNAVRSDLFASVEGCFDTIICNAPYLPDDPRVPDVALDGGPRGFEWTLRFLAQARDHLSRDGRILLLISSRTRPAIVEKALLEQAMDWRVISRRSLDFEELLVYNITWALPERPSAVFLARGKRSRVYRDGDEAIKVMDPRRVAQEALMLSKANALGLGPALHAHAKEHLVMDFVEGVRIEEFLADASASDGRAVLDAVVNQCCALDEAGIDKQEMGNPYKHIIVSADGPVLIDWERARSVPRTQNLSQFRQYLRRLANRPGLEWVSTMMEVDHAV